MLLLITTCYPPWYLIILNAVRQVKLRNTEILEAPEKQPEIFSIVNDCKGVKLFLEIIL